MKHCAWAFAIVLALGGGACQCGGNGSGGASTEPIITGSHSPSRPSVGDRMTLRFSSDQDVEWHYTLPERWSMAAQSGRKLSLAGPTPLGSASGGPHYSVAAENEAGQRTEHAVTASARPKRTLANVRKVRQRNLPGGTTMVHFDVSIPDQPVRWPERPGGWQLHFDTRGLGPSDSIEIADAEIGWVGVKQTLPSNALLTGFRDEGADTAEYFRIHSTPGVEAILDGVFSVAVQLQTERLDDFAIADEMPVTLR